MPWLLSLLPALTWAQPPGLASYEIVAELAPERHELSAEVVVQLPEALAGRSVEFLLTSELEIVSASPTVERLPGAGADGFQGINGSSVELARHDGVSRYRLQLPQGVTQLTLAYRGVIDFPLATPEEEYARGFRDTPGQIGPQGVYLAGSTLWYPYFGDDLLRFRLQARVPPGWQLISQGDGDPGGADAIANWDSAGPVDEIYLVGGPLLRYAAPAGNAVAEVYLHEPDDALARKYLDATARYLQMYSGLIGPYPYRKFALVENYWETGYGMPSFTLLGPQIIRFPFILTSSYPHEILHNWWGNSVFVDYASGNWAEGLTAYLADHLLKEQQGQGAAYRRDTLKRYRDFVKADRDFPLREFRSRHSAATEAVGYGKTLMGFHMLRLRLGDDAFRRSLASFYRKYRGRKASFDDLQAEFEAAGGQSLERFFREWVTLTGAARLELQDLAVERTDGVYHVRGRLRQRQRQGPFELDVPLALATDAGTQLQTLRLDRREAAFEFTSQAQPQLLAVDPAFDLFRMLDARETAPSIGQVFGEHAVLAVLPSAASAAEQAAYRQLVSAWTSPTQAIDFATDADIDELPPDRAAWLLGRDNRLAAGLFAADPVASVEIGAGGLRLAGRVVDAGDSIVAVARHPGDAEKAVGWIVVGREAAFDGMARKLPHYGKYSYLGFRGDEPENFLKGEWQASDSPLRFDLRPPSQRSEGQVALALPKRQPLAELPPLVSRERLMQHVNYLAAPEREGRGLGSRGLEEAADYIAAEFAAAGLQPGGEAGGYFQPFSSPTGPDGKPHELRNVIGWLPGSDPALREQAVLITAHYDHLGHGWPDERAQAAPGAIYPGADDNASGIAVLIELARAFASGPALPRSLVFVAFSGEEAGLLGSDWYVRHASPLPIDRVFAVINMDTVGRLRDQPVSILAAESASEWPHIFRG
ncbi:MAG: M28 family peptidase, partial [Gammaproteobacteria bacterium]